MTDKRYHFPGGVRDGLPRQFPAPDAAPRLCRSLPCRERAGAGPERELRIRKKKPENAEKWMDCHLPNGGILI